MPIFAATQTLIMRKNTIQSISEQTGYSVSTVSRVLSGKAQRSRISQKAIDIIKAEAKRVNYTPNLLAQGLRTSRTYTIGLTVPGIDNPFFATLASTVIENLKLAGYHTLLADSLENQKDFESSLQMFRSRSVDGIIAVPVGNPSEITDAITGSIPTVLIDRYYENTNLPYICTDNYVGGYMATEYLIGRGYHNILSIQGVEDSTPSMERVRGFKDAISAHSDKDIEYAIVGDAFSVENGFDQVKRIFSQGVAFDAVFAYSSTILLGAIRAFRELGVKVPEQVGIISFDNNGFLDFLDPAITRIEQPLSEIGRLASQALIGVIENKPQDIPPVQRLIAPTLIVRDSC